MKHSLPFRLRPGGVAGLLLTLGALFALPAVVTAEGAGEGTSGPTISVTGSASVSAAPDIAVLRLGVETRARELSPALSEAASRMAAITSSLERNGVMPADISTVDYRVAFVASAPNSQTAPNSSQPSTKRTGVPAGYFRVVDLAAVTVRNLAKLGPVLDGALTAGANEVQGVSFRLSDPGTLEREARAEAYRRAQDQAQQLAALSRVKLGKVLRIDAGSSPQPVAEGVFRAAALAAPPVSPGQLEVRVTLHVVYAIGG